MIRNGLWRAGLAVLATVTVGSAGLVMSTQDAQAADSVLPRLKVAGNRIVTADGGQDVILRGANVLRSEWDLRMDAERRVIPALATEWKGNVFLRGFASDPVNNGSASYLALLDEHVALAETHGMYVIFAWRSHEINGPQPTSPDDRGQNALAVLAARYKLKTNVMFALQVEPHDVAWAQVQPRFVQMVDAIHRASAPHKPIVMVPGVNWSRELGGAISLPVDRENVVYKAHPYSDSSKFQSEFVDTYNAGKPVFLAEFGPAEEIGMDSQDVSALLALAQRLGLGWTAWILDFQGGPSLIKDNNSMEPTPYGATVKAAMAMTPTLPKSPFPAPSTTAPSTTAPSTTAPSTTAPSTTTAVGLPATSAVPRPSISTTTVPPATTVVAPLPSVGGPINDNTLGNATNQVNYVGSWSYAAGSSIKYRGDDHYSDVSNSYATIRFSGSRIALRGSKAPWHGIASVSIDGGPEQAVDYYSADRQDNVLLWSRTALSSAEHTLRVKVTGRSNARSSGTTITLDRIDVNSAVPSSTVVVNDNVSGEGVNQVAYRGNWSYVSGSAVKYRGDDHYSSTSESEATFTFVGRGVSLRGARAPWHGIAAISVDGGPEVLVDYYGSSRVDNTVVWARTGLREGKHTLRIRVTGSKSAAATGATITIDRLDVKQ